MGKFGQLLVAIRGIVTGDYNNREEIKYAVIYAPRWAQSSVLKDVMDYSLDNRFLVAWLLKEVPPKRRAGLIKLLEVIGDSRQASLTLEHVDGLSENERSQLVGVIETAESTLYSARLLFLGITITPPERSRLIGVIEKAADGKQAHFVLCHSPHLTEVDRLRLEAVRAK